MIRRKSDGKAAAADESPRGFDSFELKLGDMMRGERATLGKSLLDVQRELKIKAAYIAAIENCDPSAFDTPGFIAGYVRSYARYLGMEPDWAFREFCAESGFEVAHGMAPEASSRKKGQGVIAAPMRNSDDMFSRPNTPFVPSGEAFLSRVEPGAVGSSLVLMAVIGLIGFGGWTVLQEVQRVNITPVDQIPTVVSNIDPLEPAGGALSPAGAGAGAELAAAGVFSPPAEALDRLYRPQALDVPVLVARDAPIATLDPAEIGAFAAPRGLTGIDIASADGLDGDSGADDAALDQMIAGVAAQLGPQVVADAPPEVALLAVRPAWVRVRAADGSVIFEKILDAGEEFVLPATEEPPTLRAGNSGSLFFRLNGEVYGPAGPGTSTAKNVALSIDALRENFVAADLSADPALAQYVAVAEAQD